MCYNGLVVQTKSSTSKLSFLLILPLLVVIIAVSFFLGKRSTPNKIVNTEITPTEIPSISPVVAQQSDIVMVDTDVLIEEDLYSIKLPQGWKKVSDKTMEDNYEDRVIRYENSASSFFEVVVDPPGRGVGSDETWVYNYNEANSKLVFNRETTPCGSGESPFCEAGNNNLNIYITTLDGNDSPKIKGHHYIFFTGNTRQEKNIDKQIYRDIVEGIVFK